MVTSHQTNRHRGASPPAAWRGKGTLRQRRSPAAPDATAQTPARALSGLSRYARRDLAVAVGAPLAAGLLVLPQLWLLSLAVGEALDPGGIGTVPVRPLLAAGGVMAARAGLTWWGEVRGSRAATKIARALRSALFGHLLGRRPDWTAAQSSGALAAAIVDQVGALDGYLARSIPAMASAAVLPLVFALAAMLVDPAAGVLLLVSAPLIPLFMALVGWGAEAASGGHQRAVLRLNGFFADRLRGLVTLKLLGRAEDEALTLRHTGEDLRRRTLAVLRIAFLSSAVLEFFAALGVAGVALDVGLTYLGFLHLRVSPLTLQAGLFCLMVAPEVYLPLRQFAAHYHDRAAAKAAVAGLAEAFGTLPRLDGEQAPEAGRGGAPGPLSVLAAGLTVATPDGARPVLENADLAAAAGSSMAILGASGAGKSTLLEVLARLRAYRGEVALGGRSLPDVPEDELRARVAVLGQHPRLFAGTIADNIRLGRAGADDRAVLAAAERAGVMLFARDLPGGLATPVGEDGLGLSGGEAHRVALARLFLRDPDLVLLDEPTAHLDAATEGAVLDGILAFAAGRTLIVATHSPVVAAHMDRVLRIEGRRLLAIPHRRRTAPATYRKGAA